MKSYLLFIPLFVLLFSCKKETISDQSAAGIKVSFTVEGETELEGAEAESPVSVSNTGMLKSNSQSLFQSNDTLIRGGEFDSYILTEEFGGNSTKNIKVKESKSSIEKYAVAPVYPDSYIPAGFPTGRQLTAGVTFRVLVYDSNGQFVESVDGVAGSSTLPVASNLQQGKTYSWYAYSYYATDPLPALSQASLANPQFNVENEDFLYASGTFTTATSTTQTTNTDVKITFKHAMAMVGFSVNLSSFNGKVNHAAYLGNATARPYIRVAANTLKKGVFNLKNGAFSQKELIATSVNAVARNNYAFTPSYPNTSYQGFFFTVPDGDLDYISNFNTSIETWTILDRPSAPKVFNKTYTHKVRSGRGKYTSISIYALDNGIAVPSSNGNTNWSRGDVYYDDSQGFAGNEGLTRFQHRNHEASMTYQSTFLPYGVTSPVASYGESVAKYGSTYYRFNNLYPLKGVIENYSGNPCQSLSPGGSVLNDKWRYPTVAQGRALAQYINDYASTGRISHTFNEATKSIVLTVNTNGQSSPDQWSERLSFEMKGYAAYNSTTNTHSIAQPSVTAKAQSGSVYIWLSPVSGVTGHRAYLELKVNSEESPKFSAKIYRNDISSPSGIDYPIPSTFTTDDGLIVRCVRNY
ncbi:hypothetical protein [Sphingobacterium sp. BN32]|uniref:fimbrillin family protein n=1 Tax=Sphingobacterium sp. BN32 TaxID=3058432 RepID=UPI00265D51F5|nr:hypothetical protein [Sphingobacterium sp. BN32]WKK56837.1 hypothetical protein QYC40_09270 [Sphingobacterium sp. BN32]